MDKKYRFKFNEVLEQIVLHKKKFTGNRFRKGVYLTICIDGFLVLRQDNSDFEMKQINIKSLHDQKYKEVI